MWEHELILLRNTSPGTREQEISVEAQGYLQLHPVQEQSQIASKPQEGSRMGWQKQLLPFSLL